MHQPMISAVPLDVGGVLIASWEPINGALREAGIDDDLVVDVPGLVAGLRAGRPVAREG